MRKIFNQMLVWVLTIIFLQLSFIVAGAEGKERIGVSRSPQLPAMRSPHLPAKRTPVLPVNKLIIGPDKDSSDVKFPWPLPIAP